MENKITKRLLTISLILQLIVGISCFTINIVSVILAVNKVSNGENYDSFFGTSGVVRILYLITILLTIFNIIYYIFLRMKKILLKENKWQFWSLISVNALLFCYFWIHMAIVLTMFQKGNIIS